MKPLRILFALPGLLDCTAALVTANGRDRLHVRLTTVPGQAAVVRRSALDRLTRYPSLRELPVAVDLAPGTLIQPGKRTLEDHRENQRS